MAHCWSSGLSAEQVIEYPGAGRAQVLILGFLPQLQEFRGLREVIWDALQIFALKTA